MANTPANTKPGTPEAAQGNNNDNSPKTDASGPKIVERYRLYHSVGGGYTDFENESDLLDFVKDAATVKSEKQPDGSRRTIYSPNAHLVHGSSHPDYPNLRVEKVSEIEFPEDDE